MAGGRHVGMHVRLGAKKLFCGFLYQIEKNNSKIVSLEKIENVSNLWGSSREDREYREVALIAGRNS